jgi:Fe-S-cluster containining protein
MSTNQLRVIQEQVQARVDETASAHDGWPCRKGCDDCCRRLASVPIVSESEWQLIAAHLERLESGTADLLRQRIRDSAGASRPVVCPLLDTGSGACLVYAARPIACRAYGFYAERENVLGCSRIESIAEQSPDVIWGNGSALDAKLHHLGPAAELYRWIEG